MRDAGYVGEYSNMKHKKCATEHDRQADRKGYPETHVNLKPRSHARKYDLTATELAAFTVPPAAVCAHP